MHMPLSPCCSAPHIHMNIFGTQKTNAERIKEYGRSIKKSVRELDRERTALERQEKKLMSDIKKAAKDGHMDSAKIMAKDLVRTCASLLEKCTNTQLEKADQSAEVFSVPKAS